MSWRWGETTVRTTLILTVLLVFGGGCQEMGEPRAVQAPSASGRIVNGERRYSTVESSGRWWLADPRNEAFFSFGVCGVDSGVPLDVIDPQNPEYSAAKIYPSEEAWLESVVGQLNNWKVSNLGGWSDWELLKKFSGLSQTVTPVLHLGASAGFPWEDMWDPERLEYLRTMAKEQIGQYGDDPRVLGYYSDNELGWWNGALFRYTLEHGPESGQRKFLIDLLEERYQGQWPALLRDFVPEDADSFRSLRSGGTVSLRPGSRGVGAYRMVLFGLAQRYYELMSGAIRSADPQALFLGDRFPSFYYREVVSAPAPWVDVISTNLKSAWTDGAQLDFFPKTLHELSSRPIVIGEVYMAAMENRSGNRNSVGGFPTVLSQKERATSTERMLRTLAEVPAVVGIDWFQYYDEPSKGRPDGEDYNMGLVDLEGRPYDEVVAVFSGLDLEKIHRQSKWTQANRNIPLAPDLPMRLREPLMALQNWDREDGLVPPSSAAPMADLYACWLPGMLYLGVYAMDHEEGEYYADRTVPVEDRMRFEVSFAGASLYIAKTKGLPAQVYHQGEPLDVELVELELNFSTRTIFVLGIPFPLLKGKAFTPGTVLSLSAHLRGHGGFQVAAWSHSLICSE